MARRSDSNHFEDLMSQRLAEAAPEKKTIRELRRQNQQSFLLRISPRARIAVLIANVSITDYAYVFANQRPPEEAVRRR